MANNIFQGNGYAFEAIVTGATGNDWNYNNWHSTRSASLSHFKWENIGYLNMFQLCAATNRIRADCAGSTLTLYANNQQIASVTDSSFSGGDVGLIAGTYETPGVDILFDNFMVFKPGN